MRNWINQKTKKLQNDDDDATNSEWTTEQNRKCFICLAWLELSANFAASIECSASEWCFNALSMLANSMEMFVWKRVQSYTLLEPSLFFSLIRHVFSFFSFSNHHLHLFRSPREKCFLWRSIECDIFSRCSFVNGQFKILILTYIKTATKVSTYLILRSKLYPECSVSHQIHSKSSKCQLIRWRCTHRTETHIDLTFFSSWK